MGDGSKVFGVFLFSLFSVPFLHNSSSPSSSSPDISWSLGCSAEGWIFPLPLCSFSLLPVALCGETVVSSFHSACWGFINSWLRRKGTTSSSSFGSKVDEIGCISFFHCQRPPGLCWGSPFCLQHSPTIRGLWPCFYTSSKRRAKGFPSSWPK